MLVVTFHIGRQRYGLPVADVHEVVLLPALITLAGAPPLVAGVVNVRGCYLPVLSGRRLLGEVDAFDLNSHLIIAGRGRSELALHVDRVSDVQTCQPRMIARYDLAQTPLHQQIADHEDAAVLVLDLAQLCHLAPALEELPDAAVHA
jgi:purine-binding chemotaxis protein CheW